MINIWFYLIGIFLALLVGAIFGLIISSLASSISKKYRKKRIPKDKKELADGGKIETNEMEVKEDARRKFENTREFERLRRIITTPSGIKGSTRDNFDVHGDAEAKERRTVQVKSYIDSARDSSEPKGTKRTVELD